MERSAGSLRSDRELRGMRGLATRGIGAPQKHVDCEQGVFAIWFRRSTSRSALEG